MLYLLHWTLLDYENRYFHFLSKLQWTELCLMTSRFTDLKDFCVLYGSRKLLL